MSYFIDKHIRTIETEQADSMRHVCETESIPAGELIKLQERYSRLQVTLIWLQQMKAAIEGPARIVAPPAGVPGLRKI